MKHTRLTLRFWMLFLLILRFSSALEAAPAHATTAPTGYWLELDTVTAHTGGALDGMITYRLYLNTLNANDFLSSCSGDSDNPFVVASTSGSWYNDAANASWNAQGINPAFFAFFPDLAFDSFLTLGAEDSSTPAAQHPSVVSGAFDFTEEFIGVPGQNFVIDDPIGGAWYVTFPGADAVDDHAAFAGEDLRVLIAQFTTEGIMSGQVQVQVFIGADQANEFRTLLPFCSGDGECGGCTNAAATNYDVEALYDDGSCLFEDVEGCIDPLACNYDPTANIDDASCEFESCQWCDDPEACNYEGEGLPSAANTELCEFILEGECDCEGNVLDAAGVCGGSCESDEDGDGVCDDVDSCLGVVDACGVCNGPGAIYECGCADIPEGQCDCNGSLIDAVGVCGGNCAVDADEDGWCDECINTPVEGYALETEVVQIHTEGGLQGLTTYRVYMKCANASDYVNACSGDDIHPLVLASESGSWFNHAMNNGFNASGINPDMFEMFPNLEFDSYLTLGAEFAGDEHPQTIWGDIDASAQFDGDASGYNVTVNDETGGAWYLPFPGLEEADTHPGFAGEEGRVLVMQMTTSGAISGQIQVQIFQNGDQDQEIREVFLFSSEFDETDCDNLDPCDGVIDACGICNGPGATFECGCAAISDGDCDCDGNQLDALGVCGGDCLEDNNGDGICDLLAEGCTDLAACNYVDAVVDNGECEYLDECGECGGTGTLGCTDSAACNYDMAAACDDGSCAYAEDYYDCAGNCLADADLDGVCDELEIVGCQDATACNYSAEATDAGECEYPEQHYDCEGNCLTDTDGDGVCDELEILGCTDDTACNYDAASTQADDSCEYAVDFYDCDGNCLMDTDEDGVCDELEIPGCTDDTACNFEPSATEADDSCEYAADYVDCAGNCLNDTDGDGVCDELEVEGCTDDTACNFNPDATDDDGSCEYAQNYYDCAGNCLNDADSDGVCDELEVEGCTDDTACNFSPDATEDDASCTFPGDACDDGDETTINDVLNDECECVGEVDGVEEATFSFEMYPNPASSVLNVTVEGLGAGSNAFVTLRSSTGQLIQQKPCREKLNMDVRGLASGLYFLSVAGPNTLASTKPVLIATTE